MAEYQLLGTPPIDLPAVLGVSVAAAEAVVPIAAQSRAGEAPRGRTAPTLDFLHFTDTGTHGTTFTFAGEDFGVAGGTRRIVVTCHWGDAATNTTISSGYQRRRGYDPCSMDGATQGNCAIMSAQVPSGTSGTIAFTVAGATADRATIGVYRALNETSSTPADAGTDSRITGKS